jgi:protein-S-isoprenylcysteine O-methyltransferase Ste14
MLTLGAVMLVGHTSRLAGAPALWHVGRTGGALLAWLTVPGFLFAWWARLHLGRLWSGSVTRKVDTGPYGIVRHPIYTGLLFACLVSAIAVGTAVALLGLAAMMIGLMLKARLEETFLAGELGSAAYAAYASRVPMLLPFAGRSR